MTETERRKWERKYAGDGFEPREEPSAVLRRWIDALPGGRALDVGTGGGRNALFLAAHGYEVDAIDISGEALDLARERASSRGLAVNWILADFDRYCLRSGAYDVVTVNFYTPLRGLVDIVDALSPDGVLCYEQFLRTPESATRGAGDRFRFGANELLRAALGLTVLSYDERATQVGNRTDALATLVARKSTGSVQDYPRVGPSPSVEHSDR